MTIAQRIAAIPKNGAPKVQVVPRAEAPRLTNPSVFSIDHRGELVKEMRADADELDRRAAETIAEAQKKAAEQIALALSLRLSADHLDANPPE